MFDYLVHDNFCLVAIISDALTLRPKFLALKLKYHGCHQKNIIIGKSFTVHISNTNKNRHKFIDLHRYIISCALQVVAFSTRFFRTSDSAKSIQVVHWTAPTYTLRSHAESCIFTLNWWSHIWSRIAQNVNSIVSENFTSMYCKTLIIRE